MEASYKRDKDHNYMILEGVGEIQGNEYQIRMILINKIPGLLECKMRKVDGRPLFYYEITSRQPVARAYEKTRISTEDIRHILIGIRRSMEGARRYLLDANHLIFDPHYIYVEPENGDVSLCYLPFFKGTATEGFRALAEYILKNLDHEDEDAVLWGYEIYSRAVRENYNLEEILQSVYRKNADKARPAQGRKGHANGSKSLNQTAAVSGRENSGQGSGCKGRECGQEDRREAAYKETEAEESGERGKQVGRILAIGAAGIGGVAVLGVILRAVGLDWTQTGGILCLLTGGIGCAVRRLKGSGSFLKRPALATKGEAGEEELIQWEEPDSLSEPLPKSDSYGETQAFMQESCLEKAVFISMEPDRWPDLKLSGERQIIGKLKERVDIVVPVPEISRIHAQVQKREDGYHLTDLNSKNGTYINGTRLETNESGSLSEGDQVQFGSARYFFKERVAVRDGIYYNEK